MQQHQRLIEKILAFVHDTPVDTVQRVAALLLKTPLDSVASRAALEQVRNQQSRACLNGILHEWQSNDGDLTSTSLGFAILAASEADSRRRSEQVTELVWTGPQPVGSQCRQTEQVILELIRAATTSIYVVSFAAYKLKDVMDALKIAAQKNILVRCVLESSEHETAGQMTMSSMHEFVTDGIPHTQVFIWPHERREQDAHGRTGKLHAKCIVIDHSQAFISSANLTEYALNLNMELGIILRGGPVPAEIANHIDLLITHGILQRVPERLK